MIEISITELRNKFGHYLALIGSGKVDQIVITKYGKPLSYMVPVKKKIRRLGLGAELFGESDCNVKDPVFDDIAKDFGY